MSSIDNINYVKITYKNQETDYPSKFCQHLADKFKLKGYLLDIGCGDGRFTEAFAKCGLAVTGLDISETARERLGQNLVNWHLQGQPYPLPDASFDVIFSKSVVEHLIDPEILIDQAYRLLKPGGVFICMTPSWKHSYKEAFYIDHTHVTPFTRHSLETICELSGFKAECNYFYQLPKLWKFPLLHIGRVILNTFQLPYRPFFRVKWLDCINKTIRFSKEAMLLCVARK